MRAELFSDASGHWTVACDDSLAVLPKLPEACVDIVITDPPYGIGIVGSGWDHRGQGAAFASWTQGWATECRRLLKPGGYLVAFGAPRTFHRLVAGVEDAGWERRGGFQWSSQHQPGLEGCDAAEKADAGGWGAGGEAGAVCSADRAGGE
jgi:DNA modification methylase